MKLGYHGSKKGGNLADNIFSTYHEKIFRSNSTLKLINTKSILNQLLFPIDRVCMRTYYHKHQKQKQLSYYYRGGGIQPSDYTRHRFFECRECTAYKIYQDLVDDGEYRSLLVLKSPNINFAGRLTDDKLYLDTFTKCVLINQYLWEKNIDNILYPANVFVCGSMGYKYYTLPINDKPNKRKIKLIELIEIYTKLGFYDYAVNDIPSKYYITESGLKMLIPDNTNITIDNIRVLDYLETKSHYPKEVIVLSDDYFILKTKTSEQRSKLKYNISLGLLPKRVQITLNVALTIFALVVNEDMDIKIWYNLFIDLGDDQNIINTTKKVDYEQLLAHLNDIKIKYVV